MLCCSEVLYLRSVSQRQWPTDEYAVSLKLVIRVS